MQTLICPRCRKEWPENYCPECERTIDRSLLEPIVRSERALIWPTPPILSRPRPSPEKCTSAVVSKVFMSHASEDKQEVALPLAELLMQRNLSVWLDQWELALGDSLRQSVEKAISRAAFGIVVLSPDYLRKAWPIRELDGLFSMETAANRRLILPIRHNLHHDEIIRRWPMLSDRLSCSTDRGLTVVADQILVAVQRAENDGTIQRPPEAVLADYRRRMLSAVDGHDLRRLRYELDDFLRMFPAHPQARILADEIGTALRYEMQPIHRRTVPSKRAYKMPPISRVQGTPLLFILLILGALMYVLYRILRFVLGW